MPDVTGRDTGDTAAILRRCLCEHPTAADVRDVAVTAVEAPPTTGFSSETILFSTEEILENGTTRRRDLVARIAPTTHALFLDADFSRQYRILEILSVFEEIPVPRIRLVVEDLSFFGAPFFVMDRVFGSVPSDNPPYTMEGWLADASPDDQARLWWSGLDAMARVHTTDLSRTDLGFLDMPGRGRAGLDQQISYYRDFLSWAAGGSPQPVAEAAFSWLLANLPPEKHAPVLCWGDARIGNMIFSDFECVAILDWEMATVAQPELDLGWWLWFDRQFSDALDVARPPGFASREETVARYEELLGREMESVEWYVIFAGLRFAVIMARLATLLRTAELLPVESDFQTNNLATQLLARELHLAPPGS